MHRPCSVQSCRSVRVFVCVCVCHICKDVKLPCSGIFQQGDTAFHWDCVQRSYQWNGISSLASWTYLLSCDHLLFRVCFHSIVNVCWWEEAQPKNLKVNFIYFFTVATICIFAETMSPMYFWLFRRDHVADELWSFWESITETLFFGFSTRWSNFVDSGLNSVWQHWMLYLVFEKYYKRL